MLHPLQIIFICLMTCVLSYVALDLAAIAARLIRERRTMSIDSSADTSASAVVAPVVPEQPEPSKPIATPENAHKSSVVRCAHINALAQQTTDDPAIIEACIVALARLIIRAKRADGSAKIGETDAIKHGLGINPGGSNPLYALARAALQAELARQRGERRRDEIAEIGADGRVIREDGTGQRYTIVDGREVPA